MNQIFKTDIDDAVSLVWTFKSLVHPGCWWGSCCLAKIVFSAVFCLSFCPFSFGRCIVCTDFVLRLLVTPCNRSNRR